MKLLVTGGLGFIGSNFILKLLQRDENLQVINIDACLTGSHQGNLKNLQNNKNYSFVKGNITNKRLMNQLISDSDVVINFAAESFVDRSISDAEPFLVSNIRGAYTILDLITKQKKRMIHISTDEVFGSLDNTAATENMKFNPSNPYAATKASAELLIQSYIGEFLKYHEIKTIWINGKFQYAYGQKVKAETEDVVQSKLDQKLLKELKKKGKEVMELLSKDFGTPFLLRIDWGCCLQNDSVCREYFLNEIECCPAMMGTDAEDHDCFERLAKGLIKKLK